MQDTGTAIWLFAYFGYWLEILAVVAIRAWRGSLMEALRQHPPQPCPQQLALAKLGHISASSSSSSDLKPPPIEHDKLDVKVAPGEDPLMQILPSRYLGEHLSQILTDAHWCVAAPAQEQIAQQPAAGKV